MSVTSQTAILRKRVMTLWLSAQRLLIVPATEKVSYYDCPRFLNPGEEIKRRIMIKKNGVHPFANFLPTVRAH
jgi:hypothetical protein